MCHLGDEWMCHLGDKEYMLVDKTWGIMPPFGMCLSVLGFYLFTLFVYSNRLLLQLRIVQKSYLRSEASWRRFLELPICPRGRGPSLSPCIGIASSEPTEATCRYDKNVCKRKSVAQCLDFFF